MGYGLVDLAIEQNDFDLGKDSRINPDGYFALLQEDEERAKEEYPLESFYVQLSLICSNEDFARCFGLHLLKRAIEEKKFVADDLYRIYTWDPEYGDPSVILFTPPTESSRDWHRYDDIMDYMEETAKNEGACPHADLLGRPIYPYDAWIDLRDPSATPDDLMVRTANMFRFNGDLIKNTDAYKIKEKFGFDSVQEMLDNIVPIIPDELVELLRYLKVFKDPNTIYQLRPMIYTYWS